MRKTTVSQSYNLFFQEKTGHFQRESNDENESDAECGMTYTNDNQVILRKILLIHNKA